ncbi:MAG: hypothetical protein K5989_10405 [Lachnospiraceae bacterium]|nr:hypothetical protein [Lachnospiraceae bacterium]
MMKRTRKLLSLFLAAAMVFSMNTSIFAEEVPVENPDVQAVGAEETAEAELSAYEPIEGNRHGSDTINEDKYAQVPDNWGINSDPNNWPTATKIVSADTYYDGNDENVAWVVYNPISYFFNPVDFHLVDGEVVVPKENNYDQDAKKYKSDNYIFRVIPAGSDTFVLIAFQSLYMHLGQNVEVCRWSTPERKTRIIENINDRYNGDEPILEYNGLKKVNLETKYNKKTGEYEDVRKKGQYNSFLVEAVLIKRENGKNTLVKGLSVKKVSFKNNLNASFPEEYENVRHNSMDSEGNGTLYDNGYELTIKDKRLSGVKFVGTDYKAQLTKTENANFKGQPSFKISFNVKGDAKKYSKDVKKAEKLKKEGSKDTQTTFNFEIAQLNIGDYKNDIISTTLSIEGKAEDTTKALEAVKAVVEKYRSEYKAELMERYPWFSDSFATSWAEEVVTYSNYNYDSDEKSYSAIINFNYVFMYVDKEVDKEYVSQNNVPNSKLGEDIKLEVKNDDIKNLKFGKNGKVSAKLALYTTNQSIFVADGSETKNKTKVGKYNKPFAYVKTTAKAGGKADVILSSQTVTDSVFGEIPFAIAKGQNNLTGAVTMRVKTDAHGDESIMYGHFKDEDHYTVESLDD